MSFYRGPQIVKDGLVLYLDAANRKSYPGSGTVWGDLSGNGNNGTLINGPTFDGGNGGSLVFDGVDDVITCGNDPSLQLTTTFTICCFCKLQPTVNNGHVSGKDNVSAGGRSISYGYGGTGTHRLLVVKNGSTTIRGTNTTLVDNTLRHIAATYDANGSIYFYEDGDLVSIQASVGEIDNVSTGWTLGASANNSFDIKGNIYISQVYNRVLTPSEILQNYNTTKGRFGL